MATLRASACTIAALLAAGCSSLADVQKTPPVKRLQFAAASQPVAACVHRRVGGKLQEDARGTYVIYDSAKGKHAEGLTHYAITVGARGPNLGFAEWRILTPPTSRRPGARFESVADSAVRAYWKPVEECAAQAEKPS